MHEFLIANGWDGSSATTGESARIRLGRHRGGLVIEVEAPFHGDPPPPARPGPTDRLWEFEVVELFVAESAPPEGAVEYTEIELSPHGHHLVLRFLGVRNVVDRALPLSFRAQVDGSRWSGRAVVPANYLPPEPWRANAYAIHGQGSGRRFLAAYPLPGPKPDFHRPLDFPPLGLEGARGG